MHKIKAGTLTAGTIKNNFKGTFQRFDASDYIFSFMCSVKKHPQNRKFLYVLAMVR